MKGKHTLISVDDFGWSLVSDNFAKGTVAHSFSKTLGVF
jgi:hypothetical protein